MDISTHVQRSEALRRRVSQSEHESDEQREARLRRMSAGQLNLNSHSVHLALSITAKTEGLF